MHPALRVFDTLPFAERLFVRGRLFTAPLEALANRTPSGTVIDVGCGHGVLSALLCWQRSDRNVIGIDPDEWKIEHAKASVGSLANARFERATIEELAAREGACADAIVVADVLYLLPHEEWGLFLASARALLKPTGQLFIKESEPDGTWRQYKALLQEQLMVRVLKRTQSSGAVRLVSREDLTHELTQAGFRVTSIEPQSRGYSTPHVLFCATPVP